MHHALLIKYGLHRFSWYPFPLHPYPKYQNCQNLKYVTMMILQDQIGEELKMANSRQMVAAVLMFQPKVLIFTWIIILYITIIIHLLSNIKQYDDQGKELKTAK